MNENFMFVGAGKAEIVINETMLPMEHFTNIHDVLHARILILKGNINHVLVSLELTSIRPYAIKRVQETIRQLTNIPIEAIWVCVTHTFSAPHTRSLHALQQVDEKTRIKNECLCKAIEDAVKKATTMALGQLQPANIYHGSSQIQGNVNRDIQSEQGWWIGENEEAFSDHEMPYLYFESIQHTAIALLYTYDMQSSMTKDEHFISADVMGKVSRYIEDKMNPIIAMYCIGAGGDQIAKGTMRVKDTTDVFIKMDTLGIHMGRKLLNSLNEKVYLPTPNCAKLKTSLSFDGQCLPESNAALHPTKSYLYQASSSQQTTLEMLSINDVVLVAIQPEIGSHGGYQIRKASPFSTTMIFTMVNGGVKYMAEAIWYDRMSYEAMNSSFAKGSFEHLYESTKRALETLYKRKEEPYENR